MNILSIVLYAEDTENIAESIQCIYKYADQIVVITSNNDNTIVDSIDIDYFNINTHTSKVNNLNNALKHCNSKWILYLNSGELFEPSETINIRNLIASAPSSCGGFLCKIENAHTLNDSGSSNGFYPRLFLNDNSNDSFFKGVLFEQSSYSIIESGKSIYPSDINILQMKPNELINPQDSLAKLKLLDVALQNEYYWYELGINYINIGELTYAEEAFFNILDITNANFYIKEIASLALSNICRRAKRFDEAILWAEIAYDLSKDKTSSLQALANAYLWDQNTIKAKEYFIELENLNNTNSYKYYNTKFAQIIIDQGLEDISRLESYNNR